METTDYCDYNLSLAFKAAGFDEPCRAHYTNDYVNDDPEDVSREVRFHYDWTSPYNYNRVIGNTSAPTLWHAQRWLREKGIAVSVQANEIQGELWYSADIITTKGINELVDGGFDYMGYEAALSAGLSAALELIKKGE